MEKNKSVNHLWKLHVALVLKNPPVDAGNMKCRFDPWMEDPLEEGMTNLLSILAWRKPWMEA